MDLRRVKEVRKLCDAVGFTPTPKTRMVGDFVVTDDEPIAQGRDWQDVLVSLPALPGVKRRLRLYDVPAKASSADRQNIELSDIAYLGNDINDVVCLHAVGWPVVVAGAHHEARAASHIVLRRQGGDAAVRELADRVLAGQARLECGTQQKGNDHE
jgi:hypothetical protein